MWERFRREKAAFASRIAVEPLAQSSGGFSGLSSLGSIGLVLSPLSRRARKSGHNLALILTRCMRLPYALKN